MAEQWVHANDVQLMDILEQKDDGFHWFRTEAGYWFWNENKTQALGPYDTEKDMDTGIDIYCRMFL